MKDQLRFINVPQENSGKTITKIKRFKSKVALFVNNKKYELCPDVLSMFYLYEGKVISRKELNDVIAYSESFALWQYALKLRQKSLYSEWRMREKLYLKCTDKKVIDAIIKRLKANDLINDHMLALDYIEYANDMLYGENKIKNKLKEKGIFEEEIKKLSFSSSLEKKKAQLLTKKLNKKYEKYNNEQKRQHVYNALLLNGFNREIALSALDCVAINNNKDEQMKLNKEMENVYSRLKRKYEGKILKEKVIIALRNKGYKYQAIIKAMEEQDYEIN